MYINFAMPTLYTCVPPVWEKGGCRLKTCHGLLKALIFSFQSVWNLELITAEQVSTVSSPFKRWHWHRSHSRSHALWCTWLACTATNYAWFLATRRTRPCIWGTWRPSNVGPPSSLPRNVKQGATPSQRSCKGIGIRLSMIPSSACRYSGEVMANQWWALDTGEGQLCKKNVCCIRSFFHLTSSRILETCSDTGGGLIIDRWHSLVSLVSRALLRGKICSDIAGKKHQSILDLQWVKRPTL